MLEDFKFGNHIDYSELRKPFILTSDANESTIGTVLAQNCGQEEKPVAYVSRKLTETQSRYSATEREFLAIAAGFSRK